MGREGRRKLRRERKTEGGRGGRTGLGITGEVTSGTRHNPMDPVLNSWRYPFPPNTMRT